MVYGPLGSAEVSLEATGAVEAGLRQLAGPLPSVWSQLPSDLCTGGEVQQRPA